MSDVSLSLMTCTDVLCANQDAEVEEHEFVAVLQSVAADEFCGIVESEFTPFVKQHFIDISEAEKFYKMYALASGFDVRKYTTKRWRDGTIKSKLFVCNREGAPYSKKKPLFDLNEVAEELSETEECIQNGCTQRKNTKILRIGCKARLRLKMLNGVLTVDQFHAGHNHELVDIKDREFQKLSRRLHKYYKKLIVANSRLRIGATRTFNMCKEHVNGFANIGASLNDFKNFHRDVKCYINERDGQLFIDRLKEIAAMNDDFFFDYEVDVDGSLIKVIWADGIMRKNYSIFGDSVSFDPTYGTNKYKMVFTPFTGVDNHKRSVTFCCALIFRENTDYFNWVFERFIMAMNWKEPEYIITDQDPGIIKSVEKVFKKARHRFCMWHIMNKVPMKYGSTSKDYTEFIKKLNNIIWDDEIEPEEFDTRWLEIMQEHGTEKVAWFGEVYLKRRQWVMAHCKDLKMGSVMRTTQRSESENSFFKKFENVFGTLMEFWLRYVSAVDQQRYKQKKSDHANKHSSIKLKTQSPLERHGERLYTHAVFDEFQEEVVESMNGLSAKGFIERHGTEFTKVKDSVKDKFFKVQFDPASFETSCSCRKFERAGIICRHIIWIYSSNGVSKIPDAYVCQRWRKDAVRGLYNDMEVPDVKELEMVKLWSEVYETIGVLQGRGKDDIERLASIIRGFREKLTPSGEELTKEQEIEQLLGCTTSKAVTILPPRHAKNKGSGKRMLSNRTKAVVKNAKPMRMCNNCKQMAHHDKRNCPNPYAKRAPPEEEGEVHEDEEEEEEEEEEEAEDDDSD